MKNELPYRETYQVNEIFHSLQGEGMLTGRMATFIRLQGCLVGCEWCDTKYTWLKGGTKMHVDDIREAVLYDYVIITGGEPTLYNLDSLIDQLWQDSRFVSLETSGQQMLKGKLKPDHITLSPKHRLDYQAPAELISVADEFKFVVDENLTMELVKEYESLFPDTPIYLMPEGTPPRDEMVGRTLDWLIENPQWRFSDRLQYRIHVQ